MNPKMANTVRTDVREDRKVEVCLGPRDLVPLGEGRRFVVGAEEIAVFRGRDGSLYAIQNRCPHRDGPLAEGILGAGQVICPYHAYKFDVATGACLTDPTCSLRTYPVREEAGEIRVIACGDSPLVGSPERESSAP